jgi:hypothetical protein
MNWENYKRYFVEKEFADDQGECWMKENHMDRLMIARSIADIPFKITSGCRNAEHNERVGGEDDSEHLIGEGSDIAATESWKRFIIIDSLLKAGFQRIGIKNDCIHAGSSEDHPQGVIWLYD